MSVNATLSQAFVIAVRKIGHILDNLSCPNVIGDFMGWDGLGRLAVTKFT